MASARCRPTRRVVTGKPPSARVPCAALILIVRLVSAYAVGSQGPSRAALPVRSPVRGQPYQQAVAHPGRQWIRGRTGPRPPRDVLPCAGSGPRSPRPRRPRLAAGPAWPGRRRTPGVVVDPDVTVVDTLMTPTSTSPSRLNRGDRPPRAAHVLTGSSVEQAGGTGA